MIENLGRWKCVKKKEERLWWGMARRERRLKQGLHGRKAKRKNEYVVRSVLSEK